LDVRNIRPVLVLRRLVEQGRRARRLAGELVARRCNSASPLWSSRIGRNRLGALGFGQSRWVVCSSILDCLGRPVDHGRSDALGSALPAQPCASAAGLRFCANGLANLYRPGNQSAAVMAALGTGRHAHPDGLF